MRPFIRNELDRQLDHFSIAQPPPADLDEDIGLFAIGRRGEFEQEARIHAAECAPLRLAVRPVAFVEDYQRVDEAERVA